MTEVSGVYRCIIYYILSLASDADNVVANRAAGTQSRFYPRPITLKKKTKKKKLT